MKRRDFLIFTIGFGASGISAAKPLPKVAFTPSERVGIDDQHWRVIDAAMAHLFPSEEQAPGAADVHATAWLHNALSMPDVDDDHRRFMRRGAIQLEQISRARHNRSFIDLDEKAREAALRTLEEDRDGKAWLRETLRYILEALLSDPVYGGNPDAIGWKWLQHRPGFPRPPKNKRYFLL